MWNLTIQHAGTECRTERMKNDVLECPEWNGLQYCYACNNRVSQKNENAEKMQVGTCVNNTCLYGVLLLG